MSTLREASKNNFTSSSTIEHVNAGSLQRIADAAETMALRYQDLIDSRDRFKELYYQKLSQIASLERTVAGLRGYIKLVSRIKGVPTSKPGRNKVGTDL